MSFTLDELRALHLEAKQHELSLSNMVRHLMGLPTIKKIRNEWNKPPTRKSKGGRTR